MSTDNKLELPPVEKAAEVLDGIHDEVLVNRFMELTGMQLNQKQAEQVIRVGIMLDNADQERQQKEAASSGDLIEFGADRLASVLKSEGFSVTDPATKAAGDNRRQGIRTAATAIAQDAELYKAALSMAAHLSEAAA